MTRVLVLALFVSVLAGLVGVEAQSPTLRYDVPDGWVTTEPSSSMRVAEFALPAEAGDEEDGEVVVYYFQGGGGSVQANLDRWTAQMRQPDGRSSAGAATMKEMTVNGLAVTHLDVSGTYIAEIAPGRSTARHDKPNYRLQAAVVETGAGPYFVKVTGPARTIERWADSLSAFVGSLRYE